MGEAIRQAELSLLSGKMAQGLSKDTLPEFQLLSDVIDGRFDAVFKLPIIGQVLLPASKEPDPHVRRSLEHMIYLNGGSTPDADRELVMLSLGVACLHAFLQENWTGPGVQTEPHELLGSIVDLDSSSLNALAVEELAFCGEPAYHLAKKATFLRLAQIIFQAQYQHVFSASWWNLRAMITLQEILDEPVGLPDSYFAATDGISAEIVGDFAGRLLLEQGILHHTLRNDRTSAQYFVRAARAFGLEYELSGALGKKTKFQQNELSQLVLLARSRDRVGIEESADAASVNLQSLPTNLKLNDDTLLEHTEFTSSKTASYSSASTLGALDPGKQPALHPLDQAVLLSLCLNVRNTQPQHGLTNEQMEPYVSRVISHPVNWSIHTMALLLRSRLEATRSRTVERSTLQLQALIDQLPTADSAVSERLLYIHAIPLPSTWEMERELALRYLSLGVVRSAMAIFERLEMWAEVVQCWQSLERPEKGIIIVQDLLDGRKSEVGAVLQRGKASTPHQRKKMDAAREAKLWCLLGDLEPHKCAEHYTTAWELSGHRSGRAARSLGGYHFARNEFPESITWLRAAVTISPLLARSWFLLGCGCVREERWLDARDAFARCVSIDEDDGESWNNLASVYLRMEISGTKYLKDMGDKRTLDDGEGNAIIKNTINSESPQHIPVENRILAFRALKQGLKFSYENWRMWQNYLIVCMDLAEYAEAVRALGRVVEERGEKEGAAAVDLHILEHLVDVVVTPQPAIELHPGETMPHPSLKPNEGRGLWPRVSDLFSRTILPRISSSPRIFRAWAKLLEWEGDSRYTEALDAWINAYKASVVDDVEVDNSVERWRAATTELEQLVANFKSLGPRIATESSTRWQFQARGFVRSFMSRTKDTFGDEPEWEKLVGLLEDLKS